MQDFLSAVCVSHLRIVEEVGSGVLLSKLTGTRSAQRREKRFYIVFF